MSVQWTSADKEFLKSIRIDDYDSILGTQDIGYWYSHHPICPNCGTNLKQLSPAANLYPHWTGGCKQAQEETERMELAKKEQAIRKIERARWNEVHHTTKSEIREKLFGPFRGSVTVFYLYGALCGILGVLWMFIRLIKYLAGVK